jgi:hypothetical protein
MAGKTETCPYCNARFVVGRITHKPRQKGAPAQAALWCGTGSVLTAAWAVTLVAILRWRAEPLRDRPAWRGQPLWGILAMLAVAVVLGVAAYVLSGKITRQHLARARPRRELTAATVGMFLGIVGTVAAAIAGMLVALSL